MAKKKDSFITDITQGNELDEIRKIAEMLNPDEKVLLVARQSRIKPGGSKLSPNTIYATDRRIILRDPSMLGLKQEIIDIPYNVITNAHLEKGVFSSKIIFNAPGLFNPSISDRIPGIRRLAINERGENGIIDAIPKKKGDNLIEIIRNGITQIRAGQGLNTGVGNNNYNTAGKASTLEELSKLASLRERGPISEEEFIKMKSKLLENDN
jgi:hypothetical protein